MNIEPDIFDYLRTTALEPHDDYTSEITYKDQKIIWNRLKEQEKEIERLKIIEEKYKDSQLYIKDFKEEIERLQKDLTYYQEYSADLLNKNNTFENIIKEVREYIENVETLATIDKVNIFSISTLKSILDKGDYND